MSHILCIIISCIIMYIVMKLEQAKLWRGLQSVLELSGEWTVETRKRINVVVQDINKYYGGQK